MQRETSTDTPASSLDREIELLLSAEREIQCHRMLAISERVAAFMTANVGLALVPPFGLSDSSG